MAKFIEKKSEITAALALIADYFTLQKLPVKWVLTENGGRFEGEFLGKLDWHSTTHEHTPPDKPQYNWIAERARRL